MNSSVKLDRLSALPETIIDCILTRLPIKEAVRTSILSPSWRYKWHSLTKIEIPYHFDKLVNAVDHILFVHCGSVDKLKLNNMPKMCNGIERWILYLSRNGIKELIINRDTRHACYKFPSSIFSCSDLTHLELTNCVLKPPAAAFKPFSKLKELVFCHVKISRKELENLVRSSPLLMRLRLSWLDYHYPPLKINAPNLMLFQMKDNQGSVQFEITPLLASASFDYLQRLALGIRDYSLVELLGSMPSLQRLEFHENALMHYADRHIPLRLPSICPIKHLIVSMNLKCLRPLKNAFFIFRSSPFIQRLDLEFFYGSSPSLFLVASADGFWEGEHNLHFRFDHLQEVKVTSFTGTKPELNFIEFLLASAPVLKTMEFEFEPSRIEVLLSVVKKLIRFPRISPKAELILP